MDGLPRRIGDAFQGIEPTEETIDSARLVAANAVSAGRAPERARRPRRRLLSVVAVATAVLAAGAATAAVMLSAGERPAIPATPLARAGIQESSILARASWLFQGGGAVSIRTARHLPALRFPPGTTYPQALTALVRSLSATGTLPPNSTIVTALPRGVVWAPAPPGPRLDLTAPAGYTLPEGLITPPALSVPGDVTAVRAARIGRALALGVPLGEGITRGVTIDAPQLRACQLLPRDRACQLASAPVAGPS